MAGPKTPPNRLGTPPAADKKANVVGNNLTKPGKSEQVSHNFKVDAEWKTEFKVFAAQHGLDQRELTIAAFEYYKEHHGG